MTAQYFTTPKRTWINCPSKNQPYHSYHGKKGIAHAVNGIVTVYFCEGEVHSMVVNPLYLT